MNLEKWYRLKSFKILLEELFDANTKFISLDQRFLKKVYVDYDFFLYENNFFEIFKDLTKFKYHMAKNVEKLNLFWYFDENYSLVPSLETSLYGCNTFLYFHKIINIVPQDNVLIFNLQEIHQKIQKEIFNEDITSLKKTIPCEKVSVYQELLLSKLKEHFSKTFILKKSFDYKIFCSSNFFHYFELHFKCNLPNCKISFWNQDKNNCFVKERKSFQKIYKYLNKFALDSKKDRKLRKIYLLEKLISFIKEEKITIFGHFNKLWKLFIDDLYKKKKRNDIFFNLMKRYREIYFQNDFFKKITFIKMSALNTMWKSIYEDVKDLDLKNIYMIAIPFKNKKPLPLTWGIYKNNIFYKKYKILHQKNNIFLKFQIRDGIFFKVNEKKLKYLLIWKENAKQN